MNSKTQPNAIRRQQGIAMMELVIVAPILLLIFLGVSEMGRALYQYNTLSKAVRDSSRYYSTQVFNSNDIAGAINLVKYGQTGVGTQLLPGVVSVSIPAPVIITASYTFTFLPGNPLAGIVGLFGSALPNPFILTATSTMRAI